MKDSNARLTRWSLSLLPYQFTVRYKSRKEHGNADGLSRGAATSGLLETEGEM